MAVEFKEINFPTASTPGTYTPSLAADGDYNQQNRLLRTIIAQKGRFPFGDPLGRVKLLDLKIKVGTIFTFAGKFIECTKEGYLKIRFPTTFGSSSDGFVTFCRWYFPVISYNPYTKEYSIHLDDVFNFNWDTTHMEFSRIDQGRREVCLPYTYFRHRTAGYVDLPINSGPEKSLDEDSGCFYSLGTVRTTDISLFPDSIIIGAGSSNTHYISNMRNPGSVVSDNPPPTEIRYRHKVTGYELQIDEKKAKIDPTGIYVQRDTVEPGGTVRSFREIPCNEGDVFTLICHYSPLRYSNTSTNAPARKLVQEIPSAYLKVYNSSFQWNLIEGETSGISTAKAYSTQYNTERIIAQFESRRDNFLSNTLNFRTGVIRSFDIKMEVDFPNEDKKLVRVPYDSLHSKMDFGVYSSKDLLAEASVSIANESSSNYVVVARPLNMIQS